MPAVDNAIEGKLALVTGASGGIGAACARALYLQNVNLALTYSSSEDNILALEEELWALRNNHAPDAANPVVSTHKVDVGSADDLRGLFKSIQELHGKDGPDILVSNAGYGKRIPDIADISVDEFDHTININLRAAFILSKLSIPHMAARGWGRIVFVSSLAAHGGGINGCHYAASKAGLHGLMKSLATKHTKDGITVNDVAPAMIGETGLIPDETFVEGTPGDVKNIPIGRLGTPREVANVVLMCCQTGYLTGQSVLLSGGLK
ncbi:3-oxoacyl-reductase FabG [Chaetomidium leptoderma]|uniref:3-oxoacyl-reductase FabG n=1 Tax=Chaetomidium leptoderma TaxID=669021 RepID=A0AAN6VLU9_9PEZI|nr:3-oxoacyl-reductase FabG [Chaetomidium leptoderma]